MFNYAFGFVDVTAYVIMFTTLFIKGSLTFRKNSEIRMTAQAAMVSVIQLLFFVYWEFVYPPSSEWWQLMEGYSTLIYSDVLFLPYVIFNKRVKTALKSLFRKKNSPSPLVVTLECPEVLRRRAERRVVFTAVL
ncbi:hypothetical protein GCK32_014568 [Trichostrongylus colubriformis]|uniref:7TM GPCR serpentine receptor class x (Srx) domain-containing protein n=1 Tax=Trichostrongylus colubriformis TaxID=6319 RepID=A0AAN8EVC9_TRICO